MTVLPVGGCGRGLHRRRGSESERWAGRSPTRRRPRWAAGPGSRGEDGANVGGTELLECDRPAQRADQCVGAVGGAEREQHREFGGEPDVPGGSRPDEDARPHSRATRSDRRASSPPRTGEAPAEGTCHLPISELIVTGVRTRRVPTAPICSETESAPGPPRQTDSIHNILTVDADDGEHRNTGMHLHEIGDLRKRAVP